MSFRRALSSLPGLQNYYIAVLFAFVVGIYMGYSSPEHFQTMLALQQSRLQGIAHSALQAQHKHLLLFGLIFLNNFLVALAAVYLGVLFMLFPLYLLVANGILVGYLAHENAAHGSLYFFLKGILPHGIIEIPVILIASAYGVRFGVLALKMLLFLPLSHRRAGAARDLAAFGKLTVSLIPLLGGLLLLAAGVESTITLWLVGK